MGTNAPLSPNCQYDINHFRDIFRACFDYSWICMHKYNNYTVLHIFNVHHFSIMDWYY